MNKEKIRKVWEEFKEEKELTYREYFVSLCAVFAFGMFFGQGVDDALYIKIRKAQQVQKGYVAPSELEFKLEHLGDYKRKPYLIMNYKGKSYLFKENEKQEPFFQKYKIKPAYPAEIIEVFRREELK